MKRLVQRVVDAASPAASNLHLMTAIRQCATAATQYTATVTRGGVDLIKRREGHEDKSWWLAPGWLVENSSEVRHATGQSTITLDDLSADAGRVIEADVVAPVSEGGSSSESEPQLRCVVTTAPVGSGLTSSAELGSQRVIDVPIESTLARYGVARPGIRHSVNALTSVNGLVQLSYDDVINACKDPRAVNDIRKEFFMALTRDGIVLLTGCPDDDNSVLNMANACAPVSGMAKTLYGTDFRVDRDPGSAGPRNNIAYTGVFLDLHNDLAYHESMPGIQMLLARRFDDAVTGGESFFVDAMAAAEDLREQRPDAFDVLTRVSRPYCKEDPNRAVPACYYYGAPHITLDPYTGAVSKVFWAPAFEAPMPAWMPEGDQRQYYEARRAFATVLREWRETRVVEKRMKAGECFIWNQVRMLHGRKAFAEPEPGQRSLHGCYCNIDDFASTARYVLGDDLPAVPLANRSTL